MAKFLYESDQRLYTISQWKTAMTRLEEDGFVVIPGIKPELAKRLESSFFDWLEGFSPSIKRDDPKTWVGKDFPSNIHGIFKHYGIGHIQPLWDAREALRHVFVDYWNTKEVLTSFDGASLLRPGMGWDKSKEWFHTDQGAKVTVTKEVEGAFERYGGEKKFRCVQGILNLRDCGEDDGGLYVAKGSHKQHAQFFKETKQEKHTENWYKYVDPARIKGETDVEYGQRCKAGENYLKRFEKVKVCAKAGDFILFYSTLAHCAVPTQKNNKTHRLAFYISMLPKALATKNELKRRKEALEKLRTTSHWACIGFKLNGEFPRSYGSSKVIENYPQDKFKLPKLTKIMHQLVGVDEKVSLKGLRVKNPPKKRIPMSSDDESSSDESSTEEEEDKQPIKTKKLEVGRKVTK